MIIKFRVITEQEEYWPMFAHFHCLKGRKNDGISPGFKLVSLGCRPCEFDRHWSTDWLSHVQLVSYNHILNFEQATRNSSMSDMTDEFRKCLMKSYSSIQSNVWRNIWRSPKSFCVPCFEEGDFPLTAVVCRVKWYSWYFTVVINLIHVWLCLKSIQYFDRKALMVYM